MENESLDDDLLPMQHGHVPVFPMATAVLDLPSVVDFKARNGCGPLNFWGRLYIFRQSHFGLTIHAVLQQHEEAGRCFTSAFGGQNVEIRKALREHQGHVTGSGAHLVPQRWGMTGMTRMAASPGFRVNHGENHGESIISLLLALLVSGSSPKTSKYIYIYIYMYI